jgi:hypothetical protein
LKILWDNSRSIEDLSAFFAGINMHLPDGGWIILNNLKECI